MSVPAELSPFQPGTGRQPPYLAGREGEQTLFRRYFDALRSGRSVPASILLCGPRGNGKTALLRWAQREVEAEGGLDVRWLVGTDLATPADLVSRLRLGSWIGTIEPEGLSSGGVGAPLRRSDFRPPLEEALAACARATPLSVLVDEAHTLEAETGLWLLNAAQTAGRRAPFLLVLAGTPDLPLRLFEMGAGFMGRATKLLLGRLDEGAAGEAIRRPLAEDGIGVEEEALAHIVRESHGYPFFVQLWGRAAWRRVRGAGGGAGPVTTAVVEEAAGEFETRRNRYYLDRFDELDRQGWLGAAREVALAFRGRARLPHAGFGKAIRRAAPAGDRAAELEAAAALEHLGFVWQAGGTPSWEPGIPSLMDYILEHAPPPDDEEAAGG